MSKVYKQNKSPYYYYAGHFDGRRIRKSTGQTNRKLADEIRIKWDGEILRYGIDRFLSGVTPESELSMVFARYMEKFMQVAPSEDRYSQMTRSLNRFLEFCKRNSIDTIKQISRNTMEGFVSFLITSQSGTGTGSLSPKYIRNIMQMLTQVFDDFVVDGLIERNPVFRIKLPKQTAVRENRVLDSRDIQIILKNAGVWYGYFLLLLETGLRAADGACILFEDFDVDLSLVRVNIMKTDQVYIIAVSKKLMDVLGVDGQRRGPVFPQLYHKRQRTVNDRTAVARNHLQKVLKQQGLKKATLHSFRHTFNHFLTLNGVSIGDRQVLLAHSSTTTTKIYSHEDLGLQKTIINSLSEKISLIEDYEASEQE